MHNAYGIDIRMVHRRHRLCMHPSRTGASAQSRVQIIETRPAWTWAKGMVQLST